MSRGTQGSYGVRGGVRVQPGRFDPRPHPRYLDDLILVPLGIAPAIRIIPPDALSECREKARSATTAALFTGLFSHNTVVRLSGLPFGRAFLVCYDLSAGSKLRFYYAPPFVRRLEG